jgi:hypothetical protein
VSRFLEERWTWGFGMAALAAPVVNALVSIKVLDRIDGT